MDEEQQVWKITDFAIQISEKAGSTVHYNTVDSWFKKLEEKRIHYINRIEETDEKCYNQLDLDIGLFIKDKREQKWSLNAIFAQIAEQFDTRLFPETSTNDSQLLDLEAIKREIRTEMQKAFEETAAAQMTEIKQQYEQLQRLLPSQDDIQKAVKEVSEYQKKHYEELLQQVPKAKSIAEERQQRLTDMFTQRRVESALGKEALELWCKKPEEKRMKKVGWFRKEEDFEAKERFIKEYINKHFEHRMKQEYGVE